VKTTSSIAFGFYNGLGDIISDLPVIEEFIKRGFSVEVFVYEWLREFTHYLLPNADVRSITSSKNIKDISPKSEIFFLTPNYLHKFSYSKTSFLSYLLKSLILKTKVKKVISSDIATLLKYTFNLEKNYLDKHFFERSYALIGKFFDIEIKQDKVENSIKKIYLFPFSGRDDKDLAQEDFLKLLDAIDLKDISILVKKDDRKRLHKDFYNYKVKTLSLENIANNMDIHTLVIANDSGPAHLGAYKGCGVVSFFKTTSSELYRPRGSGKVLVFDKFDEKVIQTVIENFNLPKK